jgi:hypothetical protein
MIDKQEVLQIAQNNVSAKGYVDYRDFLGLRPVNEPGGQWLHQVKKFLLDSGFKCHEIRYRDRWWGKCSYRDNRTHFHR